MTTRPRAFARARRLALLGLAPVLPALTWTGAAPPEKEEKKFKLLFSDRPDDPAPVDTLALRPNLPQRKFVHVQNLTDKEAAVTVEVGGVMQVVTAKANEDK